MKKIIILTVIVMTSPFLICDSVIAINIGALNKANDARANSDYAGKINNWMFFKTNSEGAKYSYEQRYADLAYPFQYHSSMSQAAIAESPEIYIYNDIVGFVYVYLKAEFPEKLRKEITKKLHKDNHYRSSWEENHKNDTANHLWENVELGYIASWIRISCDKEVVEEKEQYYYSDKNEFLGWSIMENKNRALKLEEFTSNNIPLFTKLPFQAMCMSFNKTWEFHAKLKRYNAEKVVQINELEVNPYEFGLF